MEQFVLAEKPRQVFRGFLNWPNALAATLFSVQVLGSEEAPGRTSASRANGSAFDGSYLGLAATGARRTQVYRSGDTRRRAAHKSRCSPSPSCCSELSPSDELAKQHGSRRRGCREPHTCHRCQGCQGSCHGTSCGTQQWKSDRSPDMFSQRGCDRYSAQNATLSTFFLFL